MDLTIAFITALRFGLAYSAKFLNYLLSHHVPETFIINGILRLLVFTGFSGLQLNSDIFLDSLSWNSFGNVL